jgi:hypothetical protein
MQFVAISSEDLADLPLMQFNRAGQGKGNAQFDPNYFLQDDVVTVEKRGSAGDARDMAGAQGARGCSFGRFYFSGSPQVIQEIKTTLVQK